jgi:dynein heavy chain
LANVHVPRTNLQSRVGAIFVGRPELLTLLADQQPVHLLENCIQFGRPLLIEDVGEQLDAHLEPVLLKATFKHNSVECIKLADAIVEYSNEFKLYLTTRLRNPV